MTSQYLIPFIDSIRNLFSTMLRTTVTFDKPQLRDCVESGQDVSALIGFTGRASGVLVLSFSRSVAEAVVQRFTSTRLDISHPDFADAIGELANMVAGGAKTALQSEHTCISCPSVVIGPHQVRQPRQQVLHIPCRCECGGFIAEVSLKTLPTITPPNRPHAVQAGCTLGAPTNEDHAHR